MLQDGASYRSKVAIASVIRSCKCPAKSAGITNKSVPPTFIFATSDLSSQTADMEAGTATEAA